MSCAELASWISPLLKTQSMSRREKQDQALSQRVSRGGWQSRQLRESRELTARWSQSSRDRGPVHHASDGATAKCLKLTLCPLNSTAFQRALPPVKARQWEEARSGNANVARIQEPGCSSHTHPEGQPQWTQDRKKTRQASLRFT